MLVVVTQGWAQGCVGGRVQAGVGVFVADVVSVGGAAAGGQGRDLHLNFSQVLGRAGRREARTRPELATALPPPSSALGSSPARHQPSPHYTSHHPDMRAILSGGWW